MLTDKKASRSLFPIPSKQSTQKIHNLLHFLPFLSIVKLFKKNRKHTYMYTLRERVKKKQQIFSCSPLSFSFLLCLLIYFSIQKYIYFVSLFFIVCQLANEKKKKKNDLKSHRMQLIFIVLDQDQDQDQYMYALKTLLPSCMFASKLLAKL